jgi:hypothetical protein
MCWKEDVIKNIMKPLQGAMHKFSVIVNGVASSSYGMFYVFLLEVLSSLLISTSNCILFLN